MARVEIEVGGDELLKGFAQITYASTHLEDFSHTIGKESITSCSLSS